MKTQTKYSIVILICALIVGLGIGYVFASNNILSSFFNLFNDSCQGPLDDVVYIDNSNTDGPWCGNKDHPFMSIQDGVDAANEYDTMIVSAGLYQESVIIYKPLIIHGESKETTIIDAKGFPSGFLILTDNVTVSDLTFINGNISCIYSQGNHTQLYNNSIGQTVNMAFIFYHPNIVVFMIMSFIQMIVKEL